MSKNTYYQENREKILEQAKIYQARKKEELKTYNKEYYELHETERKLKAQIYREKNRKILCEKEKIRYQNKKLGITKKNDYIVLEEKPIKVEKFKFSWEDYFDNSLPDYYRKQG